MFFLHNSSMKIGRKFCSQFHIKSILSEIIINADLPLKIFSKKVQLLNNFEKLSYESSLI